MSEFTKGELEVTDNGYGTKNVITDGCYMIACTGDSGDWHFQFEEIAEANAKELVRRWNEWPDLKQQRDDLLAACEYSHTLILRKIGQTTHAVALLEAAIAKCET